MFGKYVSEFRYFTQQIRPHQLIYQLSLIFLVTIISANFDLFSIFLALGITLLLTPSFVLMNDYAHRKQDQKANRNRFLTQKTNFNSVLISFLIIMGILNVLTWISGVLTIVFFWLLFIGTIGYGYAKKTRKMGLTYLGRFISGVFTFGLYWTIFIPEFSLTFLILAFIVGILDLVGNIAGDFRDYKSDKKAGIHTLPTVYGHGKSLFVMFSLIIASYIIGYSMFSFALPFFIIAFSWNLISLIWYAKSADRWAHAAFHGPKIQQYLWLAIAFSFPFSIDILLIGILLSLGLGMLWLIAYTFYLWSNGLIQFQFQKSISSI